MRLNLETLEKEIEQRLKQTPYELAIEELKNLL